MSHDDTSAARIRITNCHDCGERPVEDIVTGVDVRFCNCQSRCSNMGDTEVTRYPVPIWTAIQRRKRMRMKWEYFVAANSGEMVVTDIIKFDETTESFLTHFFGPADGVEVEKP